MPLVRPSVPWGYAGSSNVGLSQFQRLCWMW